MKDEILTEILLVDILSKEISEPSINEERYLDLIIFQTEKLLLHLYVEEILKSKSTISKYPFLR